LALRQRTGDSLLWQKRGERRRILSPEDDPVRAVAGEHELIKSDALHPAVARISDAHELHPLADVQTEHSRGGAPYRRDPARLTLANGQRDRASAAVFSPIH
jgi:hypothetical protein